MQKNPGFYGQLEAELNRLLAKEKEGRVEQAEFLRQLDLFIQRINDRNAGVSSAGFETPAQVGVFDYLNAELSGDTSDELARQWTLALFKDAMLSTILSSPIWKEKKEIHPEMKKQVRTILKGLSGWDMTTSRQHSNAVFDILLNN